MSDIARASARCFWLQETDKCRRSLRRYVRDHDYKQPYTCAGGWHEAWVPIEDGYARKMPEVEWLRKVGAGEDRIQRADAHDWVWDHGPCDVPHSDPRWPLTCACGYVFQEHDQWQVFTETVYRRDDGTEYTLRDAPPGAMWDAGWRSHDCAPTADGRYIMVVTPDGHQWCIDARASNCTLPADRAHHCWVRHGEPPNLTVDKNGPTCQAGAGSIATSKWHGFLRGGVLVPC